MKRMLSMILMVCILVGLTPAFAQEEAMDIGAEALTRLNISEDNMPLTRGEFVQALAFAAQEAAGFEAGTGFSDITTSDSCYLALEFLSFYGAVRGNEDGTFRPNDPITYGEAAAMACRMLAEESQLAATAPFPTGHLLYAAEAGLMELPTGLDGSGYPAFGEVTALLTNVSNAMQQQREKALETSIAFEQCFGMEKDEAFAALGINDKKIRASIFDGTSGEEKIELIEELLYYGRTAKVELQVKNGIFCGVQYIFQGSAGDEATSKSYAAASFQYAKRLREQMAEIYGEPNTTHGEMDCLDQLDSAEAFQAALDGVMTAVGEGTYISPSRTFLEGWTVKYDDALAPVLFGEETAALWGNEIGLVVSLNNLTQYGNQPQTTSVVLSYSEPSRER